MPTTAELERALHYPLGDALPPAGGAITLAEGVKWLRMALPFALDHVNLWLLRDRYGGRDGWTVVDTGIDDAATRAAWDRVIEGELQGLPIVRVLVTHMHPDHIGLAHWLCERFDAPLAISATDWHAAHQARESAGSFGGERVAAFFRSHGMTGEAELAAVGQRSHYYRRLVPAVPPTFSRLMDGHTVAIGGEPWRLIAGWGHAPEHMALWNEARALLIAGDMVLPRISTNVSVHESEPEADALALFLHSIDRFRPLAAEALVLPSHGKPFHGLHTRIEQLHAHHRERLAELTEAARARPLSAYDALPVLFRRPLDLHQTTFALGESLAHLHRLWQAGELTRTQGADGVWRFASAG